jgi:hypothetical protein
MVSLASRTVRTFGGSQDPTFGQLVLRQLPGMLADTTIMSNGALRHRHSLTYPAPQLKSCSSRMKHTMSGAKTSDSQTVRIAADERGGAGFDPYSTATSAAAAAAAGSPKKPRRTLDDMRKLSEEIKKNRQKQ